MLYNKIKMFIALTLYFVSYIVSAQSGFKTQEIDNLLNEISGYEFGDNEEALAEFKIILAEMLNRNESTKSLENKVLAVLESETTLDSKRFLSQQLGLFGTERSIVVLLEMLKNDETRDMSLYALARINSKEVDIQLSKLLETAGDELRIPVINSLGFRKSNSAVEALTKIAVSNKNVMVSSSAIEALGKIGSLQSSDSIRKLLDNPKTDYHNELLDAYINCGFSLLDDSLHNEAISIFEYCLENGKSEAQQTAALNGLIKAKGKNSGKIIFEYLKSSKEYLNEVAANNLYLIVGTKDINNVRDNLARYNEYAQLMILEKAAEYEIKSFNNTAQIASFAATDQVRVAAINLILAVGGPDDIAALLLHSQNENRHISEAAYNAIYKMPGKSVDNEIKLLVKHSDNPRTIVLLKAIGIRKIYSAFPEVINTTINEDIKVRVAAYETLAEIGKPENLELLIQIFLSIEKNNELKRMETSLAKVALNNLNIDERAKEFLAALELPIDDNHKLALIRILGATGDPNVYPKIEEFLESDDETIQKAAIQSLYNWPNLDPLNKLMDIVKTSPNRTYKILALRGYINLLKLHAKETDPNIVKHYFEAFSLSENQSEKTMVLSGLTNIRTPEAATFVMKFLDDENLKSEAELALVNILQRVVWQDTELAKNILAEMKKSPSNANIEYSVKQLLNRVK